MATTTHEAPDRRPLASLLALLGAALLPKCPLCIAAYLTTLGASASLAALCAPVLRPTALVLAAAACVVLAARRGLRMRRQLEAR